HGDQHQVADATAQAAAAVHQHGLGGDVGKQGDKQLGLVQPVVLELVKPQGDHRHHHIDDGGAQIQIRGAAADDIGGDFGDKGAEQQEGEKKPVKQVSPQQSGGKALPVHVPLE